jgi:hypothetical protein
MRQTIIIIGGVQCQPSAYLPQVVHADDPLSPLLCMLQSRQQQGDQDHNDGNHDQEFNERETAASSEPVERFNQGEPLTAALSQ